MTDETVLEVKNLSIDFPSSKRTVHALSGVNLSVHKGEIVGIVGESGCGKSVMALGIMGLTESNGGKVVSGEIFYQGEDLLKRDDKRMETIRGNNISMIFQEPMTSLNPVFRIGYQLEETIQKHLSVSKKEAYDIAVEYLKKVGIPSPEERMKQYPHQMSGGMLQRVMIAMALSCNPDILIADEPTTTLDVTIQAQIMNLLLQLKRDNTSIILITHDLGVVAETVDYVVVMYRGRCVEKAAVDELFLKPLHPYTLGLMKSVPQLGAEKKKLYAIPGNVSDAMYMEKGCRFWPRCEFASEKCKELEPELVEIEKNHWVRCQKVTEGERANE